MEEQKGVVRTREERRNIDGILLLDKPIGLSSNQALQQVKRHFRARKAGHTGSLDPLASGMLPICLGEATKISPYLLGADKIYRVTVSFGTRTTTGDAEGTETATGATSVSESELLNALRLFLGVSSQTPPMFSALKHEGRRLYELAREGKEVPRQRREINIREFVIESYDRQRPVLRVRCSKGTYIRSLVEDVATAIGTVAHVAVLRRLCVEPFAMDAMVTLPELEAASQVGGGTLERLLVPADRALNDWPVIRLDVLDAGRIRQGQGVTAQSHEPAGLVRLYTGDMQFLGIGERLADCRIVPRRLFATP